MSADFVLLNALLIRPIAYHRALARVAGSATAGLFLSQLYYWTDRAGHPDGWVYKTWIEWEDETGLTLDEQRSARRTLKQKGLIDEDKASSQFEHISKFDRQLCYRVNKEQLYLCLCSENSPQTRVVAESGKNPIREEEKPNSGARKNQFGKGKIPTRKCEKPSSQDRDYTTDYTKITHTQVGGVGGVKKVSLSAFLPTELQHHSELLADAVGKYNLGATAVQTLIDTFAGALAAPVGHPGRIKRTSPNSLKKWLDALARAISSGDFVESETFLAGRGRRQSQQAMSATQSRELPPRRKGYAQQLAAVVQHLRHGGAQ